MPKTAGFKWRERRVACPPSSTYMHLGAAHPRKNGAEISKLRNEGKSNWILYFSSFRFFDLDTAVGHPVRAVVSQKAPPDARFPPGITCFRV